ncbi:rod shape-determining protein MreD [Selenomonadales bacterium OttesenSCG-928-I06]|nr:rod shape-determining protein MreD [Selenomonadales bacterium OttesenSCG-928-I06]
MKKLGIWFVIILIALIIQTSCLGIFFPPHIKPDLLLAIVISVALLYGKEAGFFTGLFAGILQDLISGNIFGLNALSKMIIGYTLGLIESQVFKENTLLSIVSAIIATFFNAAFLSLFIYLLNYKIEPFYFFINHFILNLILNIIITVPVHHSLHKFFVKNKKN